ncbi:MAG: hypothetical protein KIT83_21230 [Bryobacterales bacterium]|nr:hypothetical protein [Bryobacterales bacterium]
MARSAWLAMALLVAILPRTGTSQDALNTGACAPAAGTHENINAVLWVRTSLEYRHVTTQAFRLASLMLDRGLADRNWTAALEQTSGYENLPPAVVLDVDETVLDNSPAQVEAMKSPTGLFREEDWDRWVRKAEAKAIPGAAEFLKLAAAKGVEIFYVTNREPKHEADTVRNLAAEGLPFADADHLLLTGEVPGWGSDKASRRRYVASRYRIVLLVGDDANDFMSGVRAGVEERMYAVAPYGAYLGTKWIMLPNPTYGSWENAIWGGSYPPNRADALKARCEMLR